MRAPLSRVIDAGTKFQLPTLPFLTPRECSPWLFTSATEQTRPITNNNSRFTSTSQPLTPTRRRRPHRESPASSCLIDRLCNESPLPALHNGSKGTQKTCKHRETHQLQLPINLTNGRDSVPSGLSFGATKPLLFEASPLSRDAGTKLNHSDIQDFECTHTPQDGILRSKGGRRITNATEDTLSGERHSIEEGDKPAISSLFTSVDRTLKTWKRAMKSESPGKNSREWDEILHNEIKEQKYSILKMTIPEWQEFWPKFLTEKNVKNDPEWPEQQWKALLLWLILQSHPASLRFLIASSTSAEASVTYIAEALVFVAQKAQKAQKSLHRHGDINGAPERHALFVKALLQTHARYGDALIRLFMVAQCLPVFEIFVAHSELHEIEPFFCLDNPTITYSCDVYILLSAAAATHKNISAALELLRKAKNAGARLSYKSCVNAACTILREAPGSGGRYQDTSIVVSALLEIGIELDTGFYNVLLSNSARIDDFDTTTRLFNIMREGEIPPDQNTYTMILDLCRKTGNSSYFWKILNEIDPHNRDHIDPLLMRALIRCHYRFGDLGAITETLKIYEHHYSMTPLIKLGIIPNNYQPVLLEESADHLPQPTQRLLFSMLVIFLSASSGKHKYLKIVYDNFHRHLRDRDPIISQLGGNNHAYNAFLKAYMNPVPEDNLWAKIIADMVEPHGNRWQALKPDNYTWNILVNAFSRSSQPYVAEELYKAVREKGFAHDSVTWNSLLSGYSRAQNIAKSAGALQKFDLEEWPIDEYTIKAVQPIRDRDGLLKALREKKGVDMDSADSGLPRPLSEEHRKVKEDIDKVSNTL